MVACVAEVLKVCFWIYLGIISKCLVDSEESANPVDSSTLHELLHQTSASSAEDEKETFRTSQMNFYTTLPNWSILREQDNDRRFPIEISRFGNGENNWIYEKHDWFSQDMDKRRQNFQRRLITVVGVFAGVFLFLLISGFCVFCAKRSRRRSRTPCTATTTRTYGFMDNNSTPAMNSTDTSISMNHSNAYSTMPLNPYLLSASLHQTNHPGGISNPEFLRDSFATTVPDRNNDLSSYSDCYSHTTTTNISEPPPSYSSVVEMNSDVTET